MALELDALISKILAISHAAESFAEDWNAGGDAMHPAMN
jgi:hypothetical protein